LQGYEHSQSDLTLYCVFLKIGKSNHFPGVNQGICEFFETLGKYPKIFVSNLSFVFEDTMEVYGKRNIHISYFYKFLRFLFVDTFNVIFYIYFTYFVYRFLW